MSTMKIVDKKSLCWQVWMVMVLIAFSPFSLYAQGNEQRVQNSFESTQTESDYTVSAPEATQVSPSPHYETRFDHFYNEYIQNRLEIGTRISYRFLTNKDSGHKYGSYGTGTYLGTIYALDEKQNYCPNKFFVKYFFTQYLGFKVAYDSIKAKTLSWSTSKNSIETDGDVILSGPTIALIAKYPNRTRFTPYADLGLGFFHGDFDREPTWAYTDWGSADRNRYMLVDDTTAVFVDAGVTYQIYQNWYIDGSIEYMHADADATFKGYTNTTLDTVQTGHYPLNNISLNLGLGYSF